MSSRELFGANANWHGPIWMPIDYSLVRVIEEFHRFRNGRFKVMVPYPGDAKLTLKEVPILADRLVDLSVEGWLPGGACGTATPRHRSARSRRGTSDRMDRLLANLARRGYRDEMPEFWSRQSSATSIAAQKRSGRTRSIVSANIAAAFAVEAPRASMHLIPVRHLRRSISRVKSEN
jgi:hypothetical protein